MKDGSEFDSLSPSPDATDTTVKKCADVEDTLALIQKTVPQTLWQTKKIAQRLKGKTLDETCSNVRHFVYDHIKYKKGQGRFRARKKSTKDMVGTAYRCGL